MIAMVWYGMMLIIQKYVLHVGMQRRSWDSVLKSIFWPFQCKNDPGFKTRSKNDSELKPDISRWLRRRSPNYMLIDTHSIK